jgi:signal transduction histidine kinase
MEDKKEIVLFIIVGTLVLLFLIMALIIFVLTYQRKLYKNKAIIEGIEQSKQLALFEASTMTEEKEKERISRNIHDEVKPMLILLSRHIEKKEQLLSKTESSVSFEKEYALIDKIFDSLSHITDELVPSFLNEQGLLKSLYVHISDLNALGTIRISANLNSVTMPEDKFTHNQLLSIYRISLELLNNIIKHSACTAVNVEFHTSTTSIGLTFWHNGTGISNDETNDLLKENKGLGLKSIKARVLLLNGNVNFLKNEDGSEIIFTAPIPQHPIKTT